jgi:hypothetical protein
VRLPDSVVVIISLQGGKMKSEQIHWDQASVLVQFGLVDPTELPVAGVEVTRKALDPAAVPSNLVMKRTIAKSCSDTPSQTLQQTAGHVWGTEPHESDPGHSVRRMTVSERPLDGYKAHGLRSFPE